MIRETDRYQESDVWSIEREVREETTSMMDTGEWEQIDSFLSMELQKIAKTLFYNLCTIEIAGGCEKCKKAEGRCENCPLFSIKKAESSLYAL